MFLRLALATLISACLTPWLHAADAPETVAGEGAPASLAIAPFDGGGTQAISVQHGSLGAVFEGDILLQVSETSASDRVLARGFGTAVNGALWPDGVLPYTIDSSISSTMESRILSAIAHWNQKTPVTIVERTSANASSYPNYVTFTDYSGCASYLGRIGGQQPIYTGSACSTGNVIHEIGHALGLYHEHTRPDRDDHIQLNWGNINSSYSYNFDMVTSNVTTTSAYDLGSVMHYGEYFFTTNGQKTLESIYPTTLVIGQRSGLSDLDIAGINALYASEVDANFGMTPTHPYSNQAIALQLTFDNTQHSSLALTSTQIDIASGAAYVGNQNSDWSCTQSGSAVNCAGPTLGLGQSSTLDLSFTAPASVSSDLLFFATSTVTPSSGGAVTHTASASFDMTSYNMAPVITAGQYFAVSNTSLASGTYLGRVEATDPNGDAVQAWQLLSTDAPNAVQVVSATGDLFVDDAAAFAASIDNVIAIGLSASDGSLNSVETQVTLGTGAPATAALTSKSGDPASGAVFSLLALIGLRRRTKIRQA